MIFYELVEKKFSNRGNIIPITQLEKTPRNHKAFISLFGYGPEIVDWVKMNGSVEGFSGSFHLQTFYFDIDNEDLNKSLKDTQRLVKLLYKNYGVHPDDLLIYFSGNKGFHVGLPQKLFGGFDANPNLPSQIKNLAKELVQDKVDIDFSIYKPNLIFRLPHSKHSKSGKFKVPISINELADLDEILEIAEYPRPEFSHKRNSNDIVVNQKLKTLWDRCLHTADTEDDENRRRLKDGGFFKPVTEMRNNTLFKQAAMLFDKGLDFTSTHDIIKSINTASGNPLPDKEIYTLTNSARKKTKTKQVEKTANKNIFTVADMVPDYLEYLSPSSQKLSLLFESFSEDTKFKLRGKFVGIFGKDGTKKSLFCQNLVYKNMAQHGARSVVSNMEMGKNPLMSRIVDRTLRKYKIRPSYDMERDIIDGREETARKKLDLIAKHYKDKLVVSNESAMTADDYRKLIKDTENKFGKVDILVVDGFSMMGGGSSDRFHNQEVNSRELKEIAKDLDVAVFGIFHANAQCKKWYRRADRYVRGSDKQLDNVDITVSLSLLIDAEKTESETDVYYREDIGYATMYNKRGSGNVIRRIFDFNSSRLSMGESDAEPSDFEVNINRL